MGLDWKWENPPLTCGILVCCDSTLEWLLPWWWERVQAVGSYPVAFVDLGMSEEGRTFCQKHGALMKVEKVNVAPREEIDPALRVLWEKRYGKKIWDVRHTWFMKPFALLETPFQTTLYLDIDCEVITSLDCLLQPGEADLTLADEAYDHGKENDPYHLPGERYYNSGVVLYRHGAPSIQRWAEEALAQNHKFFGDDFLLSRLIFEEKWHVEELPRRFHVRPLCGVPLDAAIIHWGGIWGKNLIREQGGMKGTLDHFRDIVCRR